MRPLGGRAQENTVMMPIHDGDRKSLRLCGAAEKFSSGGAVMICRYRSALRSREHEMPFHDSIGEGFTRRPA